MVTLVVCSCGLFMNSGARVRDFLVLDFCGFATMCCGRDWVVISESFFLLLLADLLISHSSRPNAFLLRNFGITRPACFGKLPFVVAPPPSSALRLPVCSPPSASQLWYATAASRLSCVLLLTAFRLVLVGQWTSFLFRVQGGSVVDIYFCVSRVAVICVQLLIWELMSCSELLVSNNPGCCCWWCLLLGKMRCCCLCSVASGRAEVVDS
jgi:hypothetical protein